MKKFEDIFGKYVPCKEQKAPEPFVEKPKEENKNEEEIDDINEISKKSDINNKINILLKNIHIYLSVINTYQEMNHVVI